MENDNGYGGDRHEPIPPGLSFDDRNIVFEAIHKAVGDDQADWDQIVKAVKSTGVHIANWLDVRGILQMQINAGLIARTDDVYNEVYVRLS